LLIAEEHDLVVEERLGDTSEGVVVQRLGQVDSTDLCTQMLALGG
jgi:hypothetical protein